MELFLFALSLELFQQVMDGQAIQPHIVDPRPDQQHHPAQKARRFPDGEGAVADIALPQQHQDGYDGRTGDGLI